jgi:hypothetical protein
MPESPSDSPFAIGLIVDIVDNVNAVVLSSITGTSLILCSSSLAGKTSAVARCL